MKDKSNGRNVWNNLYNSFQAKLMINAPSICYTTYTQVYSVVNSQINGEVANMVASQMYDDLNISIT